MGKIFEAVTRFLTADDWPIKQIGDDLAYSVTCQGQNGEWACVAEAIEEKNIFVFYSACPVEAPEEVRPRVAELLTRINYGRLIGNFEMDYEDGHIRFRTSIDITGHEIKPFMISQLVYANVQTMDQYLPAIKKVIEEEDVYPVIAMVQVE